MKSMYEEAMSLVREVEAYLVSDTNGPIPLVGTVKRLLLFPAKFLWLGIIERLRWVLIWWGVSIVLLLVAAQLIQSMGTVQPEFVRGVGLVMLIAPMFLLFFAVPSTYVSTGVSKKSVDFVVSHLNSKDFTRGKQIELFMKTVELLEDRARSRITTAKWIVGSGWAVSIYALSKTIDIGMSRPEHLSSGLSFAFGVLFCSGIAYLIVAGYEAAIARLFRTIKFGCYDSIANLESE